MNFEIIESPMRDIQGGRTVVSHHHFQKKSFFKSDMCKSDIYIALYHNNAHIYLKLQNHK